MGIEAWTQCHRNTWESVEGSSVGNSEEATINLKLNCDHTQILPRSDTRETTSAIAIVLCSNVEVRMEG